MTVKAQQIRGEMDEIMDLVRGMDPDEIAAVVDSLPPHIQEAFLDYLNEATAEGESTRPAPPNPLLHAQEVDPAYRSRPHLDYLSKRVAAAVRDVEAGQNRFIRVSMPPRMGKSMLCSTNLPSWILRKHPEWKLGLISHSPFLAVSWGRTVRTIMEEHRDMFGVELARDAGAAAEWQTTKKGGIISRSTKQSITGLGFKVFIIDDAVKDFADAHSGTSRDAIWNWWLANAYTRLEEPYLVIVIGTRWHEDDFLGRLASSEYEGDPGEWEVIEFPAIAEENDVLGREPGEPLISPLKDETKEEALARWDRIKRAVGTYAWSALYQQRPAPSKGAIFDTDWWRYWTTIPALASKKDDGKEIDPDGRILLINPEEDFRNATWLDSWDCAFKATDGSDYVVGQRWAMKGIKRFLMWQKRKRMTFTETVETMKAWANPLLDQSNGGAPWSSFVHKRLVEDKANGTAVIDTLRRQIPGMKPVNPTDSKEGRARAVTPECESGDVVIPLPSQEGNEWVQDWIGEMRDFPSGAHDDQVDSTTQALSEMRTPLGGGITVPGRSRSMPGDRRGQVAQTQRTIRRAGGRG